jgi:hypothetical protein|eukprot:COSAG02_NODE_161_length_32629_cov_10.363142_23_plen_93_part_00
MRLLDVCMHEHSLSHDDFATWVVGLETTLVRLEYNHYAGQSGTLAAAAGEVNMTKSDFGMAVVAALVAAGRQDVAEYESRCGRHCIRWMLSD